MRYRRFARVVCQRRTRGIMFQPSSPLSSSKHVGLSSNLSGMSGAMSLKVVLKGGLRNKEQGKAAMAFGVTYVAAACTFGASGYLGP